MNLLVELQKIEHEIRDLEYRQISAKNGITDIRREITLLSLKELALTDNIKNLKKNSVIVLAAEFRRSKEDLNRTRIRLDLIGKDKVNLEKALKIIDDFLEKARAKLADLKELETSNVLQGDFGSKNE